MHEFLRLLAMPACVFLSCPAFLSMAYGNAPSAMAQNPIVWADVPDLAIIRVGDTYYMSSTTMHMSPGLPIMKSRDLLNWQLVGYAYDNLGDNDALTLRNGKSAYGAGSWASSLRHHNGKFYVSTFSSTTGKTHIFTANDIENGPWKEFSFRPALHDHSLHFEDDGRAYMIHGGGNVRLTELKRDLSGIEPGGADQVIIPDASLVAGPNVGLPAEGSQLRKIDGKYYLSMITWPRGGMRTQLIFRSEQLTGPYEGRVALQHAGIAQGGLIDTPQGDWYALLFQDHGAVGRIPFLVPATWRDGWPVLGVDGKVPDSLDISASAQGSSGLSGIVASDEFDRQPGERLLPLAWQWNHNPDDRHWSLTARPGFLRLTTGRLDADFLGARNSLTQRTFGPECSAVVSIDVSHMQDGDFAGLALLQKQFGFVGVTMADGVKSVVVMSAESNSPQEFQELPPKQNTVHLKANCDFRDRTDKAVFYFSLDGETWRAIGRPLQMAYTLPHFMGYRFALFNFATETPGGFVDFDYFRIGDSIFVRN
jgi:beta-xylosidase